MSKDPSSSQTKAFSSPKLYHFCGYCFEVCGTYGALTKHGTTCSNALQWDQLAATKTATAFRDLYVKAGLNTMSPHERLQSTPQDKGRLMILMRRAMELEVNSGRGQGIKRARARCEKASSATPAPVHPPPLPNWAESTPSTTSRKPNVTTTTSARVTPPQRPRNGEHGSNDAISEAMYALDNKIERRSMSRVTKPPGARFHTAFLSFVSAVRTHYPKATTSDDLPRELTIKGRRYAALCGTVFDLSSQTDTPLLRTLIDRVKVLQRDNESLSSSLQKGSKQLAETERFKSLYESNREERIRLRSSLESQKEAARDLQRQLNKAREKDSRLRRELEDTHKVNDRLRSSLLASDITSASPIEESTSHVEMSREAKQYLKRVCESSHHIIINEPFVRVKFAFLTIPLQTPRYIEYLSETSIRTLVLEGLNDGHAWWEKLKDGEVAEIEYSSLRTQQQSVPEVLLYSKPGRATVELQSGMSKLSAGLRTVLTNAVKPELFFKSHALWGLLGDIKIRLNPAGAEPLQEESMNFYHPIFADTMTPATARSKRRRFNFMISSLIVPLPTPIVLKTIDSSWSPPQSVNGSIAGKFPASPAVVAAVTESLLSQPSLLSRSDQTPRHALLRGSFPDVARASLLVLRQDAAQTICGLGHSFHIQPTICPRARPSLSSKPKPVAWTYLHPIRDASAPPDTHGSILCEIQEADIERPPPRTYTYPGIEVRTSDAVRGKGVFVTHVIPPCLLIPILGPPHKDGESLTHVWHYTGNLHNLGRVNGKPDPDHPVDAARGVLGGLGITMMINEAYPTETINCILWGNCIRTLREIRPGEELLTWYGDAFEDHRDYAFDYDKSVGDAYGQARSNNQPTLSTVASFVRHYYVNEVESYSVVTTAPQILWARPTRVPRK